MKNVPLRYKYRFVLKYGVITCKENKYIFTAFPDKDCPVLQANHKSKWTLIEEIYHLIKELN